MSSLRKTGSLTAALAFALSLAAIGCGKGNDGAKDGKPVENLAGTVKVDGSSTVFPISEAVAEEFGKVHKKVRVTVGISGTGGGFKKFVAGEIDISDASRPIKSVEVEAATKSKIDFIEIPVAYDGLSVLVNPKNTWVDHITTAELKKIWEPSSTVEKWSDIRSGWPDKAIKLYGPGTDSGTFDYFTEAINGKERACRKNFTPSEDDNALVVGIAGDEGALGYFGYAYYAENKAKLKLVPVDAGKGPITPTPETINNGTYKPLSRPIFIYVSSKAVDRPEVQAFVKYYLASAPKLVKQVGYIPLPQPVYDAVLKRFEAKTMGTVYGSGSGAAGKSLEQLYGAK